MKVFTALNGLFIGLNGDYPVRLDPVGQTFFRTLRDLDEALAQCGLKRVKREVVVAR